MSARFQAARYGPEFGDAIAVLFDTQTKKVVQTWVSSSLGFAKSDIVRGTEIPRDEVEWISSDDMNALMESEA